MERDPDGDSPQPGGMNPLARIPLATRLPPRFYAAFFVASALMVGAASAAPRDVPLASVVPGLGDHTLLSWREGPPYFTTARYSADRRFLRLETGFFAAEFDTERIALTGFACLVAPRDEAAATQAALTAEPLSPAQLLLSIRVGNTTFACTGRRQIMLDGHGLPASPLEFPVRVIESGRFFQKFTLHDLEFRDPAGQLLPAAARLEIALWPDRFALTLVVRPEASWAAAHVFLRLQSAGGRDASLAEEPGSWEAAVEHRATLTLAADGSAVAPVEPAGIEVRVTPTEVRGRATVRWNAEELCHTIRLESPPWPTPTEGIYPESMLDAWETYAVTLENRTEVSQRIGLNFDHTPAKSISSYVPMIVDDQGNPTGIPVQISKNWHTVKPGQEMPYAGSWMHGRTSLNLPAHARVAFRYGTTFARWGGVPTASLAQLSLVGWGHNGFWDQFALGGFGESFCFQPARVMRRSLLTDFRPLYQRGFAKDERWAWTGNVGGGDTMVRLDPQDRYVPFKRNVTRYVSHGPNLAHLVYEELSADAAVRSRVEVLLPRTDDGVRVFLRLRYDVSRHVEFSRLALFQLGADFYNDADSPLIAWGHAGGLIAENRPKPESGLRLLPVWEASGEQPWISLHGEARADLERTGQATRGLVVREWRAVLGGRLVPAPYFAAVGNHGTKSRLAAEIVPPPSVTALEPGDQVDLLLELLALPLSAERYYGPNAALGAALAAGANTWQMVHREADANRPMLQLPDGTKVRGWPLTVPVGASREIAFTLHGGLGWIPVRLTGLTQPNAAELFRVTRAGRERVAQGYATRAFWQTDYDVATGRWSVTYNLPAAEPPTAYVAFVRDSTLPQPATTPRAAVSAKP